MKITVRQQGDGSVSFYQFDAPEGCERVELFDDVNEINCKIIKFKSEEAIKLAQKGFLDEVSFIVYHMNDGFAQLGLLKHIGMPPPTITVS